MKKFMSLLLATCLLASTFNGCGRKSPMEAPKETNVSVTEAAVDTIPETSEQTVTEGTEAAPETASYYGTWEVKEYKYAHIAALTQEEANAFVGKRITYQEDAITMDGETVVSGPVTYEVKEEPYDEARMVDEAGADLGEWWNGVSEVTDVRVVSPEFFFGQYILVVDSNTIWIYCEGVFFLATRTNA